MRESNFVVTCGLLPIAFLVAVPGCEQAPGPAPSPTPVLAPAPQSGTVIVLEPAAATVIEPDPEIPIDWDSYRVLDGMLKAWAVTPKSQPVPNHDLVKQPG